MVGLVHRLEILQLIQAPKHDSGFIKIARELRVLVPPVWPVRVRRCKMPEGVHGDCALVVKKPSEPHYVIRVAKDLDEQAQVYVLMHEWAHALSWGSESHRIRNHGPEWGIAMSRIWQALVED